MIHHLSNGESQMGLKFMNQKKRDIDILCTCMEEARRFTNHREDLKQLFKRYEIGESRYLLFILYPSVIFFSFSLCTYIFLFVPLKNKKRSL